MSNRQEWIKARDDIEENGRVFHYGGYYFCLCLFSYFKAMPMS